jgi:hypothetical protein
VTAIVFARATLAWPAAAAMVLAMAAPPGHADPAAAATSPAETAPVSAETLALRKLRDTLAMDGDQRAIVDARVQIDALLARQPEPPAGTDILREAASRMEAASAALQEAARQPALAVPAAPSASPAPNSLPAGMPAWMPAWMGVPVWGVPRLAYAAGLAALILLCAIAALIMAGRRLVVSQAAAQAALQAGGKLFDAAARRFARAQDEAGQAAEAASGAASQAGQAAARLAGAVRDTEARLRACLQDAETRMHTAGAMARHYEQSTAGLPGMLADAVQTIVARGLPAIEDASSALRDSANAVTAQFETEARALPALLADAILAVAARGLPAMETATAELAAQAGSVAQAAASLAQANASQDVVVARLEAIANAPPAEADPATVSPAEWRAALDDGTHAMQAARQSLGEVSDRLAETAATMAGALAEAGSARDASEAANSWPAAAAALAAAADAVQFQARGLSESAIAHDIALLDQMAGLPIDVQALRAICAGLQDDAAELSRATASAAAFCFDQSEASQAARTALDALPDAARSLKEICVQLGQAGAGLQGTGALLRQENEQLRDAIAALHDGLLDGFNAMSRIVREEAAALHAAAGEREQDSAPMAAPVLAALQGAIDHIQGAAARVLAGADAQEVAASRVAEAAQAALLAAMETSILRLRGTAREAAQEAVLF